MIDLNTQLDGLEKLFKLMRENGIKEVSCDYVHVVLDSAPAKPAVLNDQEYLDKHVSPLQNEPWLSISDDQLDKFTQTSGKV